MMISRRSLGLGVLITVLALLAGSAWWFYRQSQLRRLRAELSAVAEEAARGRTSTAYRHLVELSERWPSDPEVLFRLGEAELARGQRNAALSAWERIGPGSRFFPGAVARRAEQLINMGRYTAAEDALDSVGSVPNAADRYALLRARSRLYRFEGRVSDVRRLVREALPLSPDPTAILKELWLLDSSPLPVEAWQVSLEHADADDDRVWLGRGHLAVATGRYDEAAGWFRKCQERRPTDRAVARGRLDLARAVADWSTFADVARRLPASEFTPVEVGELRAWLARVAGSPPTEESAWRALLERDPGHTQAWDRLATLATLANRGEEAAQCLRRKATIDQARDRYRKILLEGNLVERAGELAPLAAAIGRTPDADAWKAIRDGRPIAPVPEPVAAPSGTLTELLADLSIPTPRPTMARRDATVTVPRFTDEAETAGLPFTFDSGTSGSRLLPETMSGGVGLLDHDGDGWLDVYVVQGGRLQNDATAERESDRLFRNRGNGTFEDVTERSGIAALPRGYGLAVCVGDPDNDGDPDLFLSRLDSYVFLRNNGDGTFQDATAEVGLAGRRDNPSSAAFADLDNDGDLDLYVCHYMIWDPSDPRLCHKDTGEPFYCDPSKVDPAPDHVFRNEGGHFVDVTAEAGFTDPDGRSLGVIANDLDDDGLVDLYVANDGTANRLFHNKGGFRFEEVGHLAGVAGSADGGYQAGMGVACGDLDGDGRPDLFVTNFYGESTTYYRNLGGLTFSDESASSGLGIATRYLLGFGLALMDYDNDGRPDLIATNGHVNDNRPFYPYGMPSLLLANLGGGKLRNVSADAGPPWSVPRVGRGLAAGDLDHDGRIDAVIVPQNSPLALFRNRTEGGRFLVLQLEGSRSNRDGVGARVTVRSGGVTQVGWRVGGGSYQSAGSGRLHFGLGRAEAVEEIEVRWPSGQVDRYSAVKANEGYRVREGASTLEKLPGYPGSVGR